MVPKTETYTQVVWVNLISRVSTNRKKERDSESFRVGERMGRTLEQRIIQPLSV